MTTDDWLSITIAPFDSRVLVYSEVDGVTIGIYTPILSNWYYADDSEATHIINPTHWQPLPPPPSKKK
jgi:hypothetical protein